MQPTFLPGLIALALLAACGGGGGDGPTPPPVPVASRVALTPAQANVEIGQSITLAAQPVDASGAPVSGYSVTFTSAPTSTATVDGTGRVTGVALGAATITATAQGARGSASGTATIQVTRRVATRIDITSTASSVTVGETILLSARTFGRDGSPVDAPLSWRSDAPAIATVDSMGRVAGIAPGDAAIRLIADDASATVVVRVRAVPVARVEITPAAGSIVVGSTFAFTAIARDSAGRPLSGRVVQWNTSAPAIATVSASGVVTALAPGTVDLVATVDGVSSSATIVTLPAVASVTVTPDSVTIPCCTSQLLGVLLRDAAGASLTGRPVAWSSSDPAVATVDAAGRVSAVTPGRAVITAAAEGRNGQAVVWSAAAGPQLLFVIPPATSARAGQSLDLLVRATPGFGTTAIAYNGPVSISIANGDGSALFGITTVIARGGEALFEHVGLRTAGTYRLRASGPSVGSVESAPITIVSPGTGSLTVGTVSTTSVAPGIPGTRRYTFTTTLRGADGVPVNTPTPITATVVRGNAGIVSGGAATTGTNGVASFSLVVRGTTSFDALFSAPEGSSATSTFTTPSSAAAASLVLAARDSVVQQGGVVPASIILSTSQLVHGATFEVSWNPAALTLEADTTVVTGAFVVVNRDRVADGMLRISLASSNPIVPPGSASTLFRLAWRAGTTEAARGIQRLRIVTLDAAGPFGERVTDRFSLETLFRVP